MGLGEEKKDEMEKDKQMSSIIDGQKRVTVPFQAK